MAETITKDEFIALVKTVFSPGPQDKRLAILVDFPDDAIPDNDKWQERRFLAQSWKEYLKESGYRIGIEEVLLVGYQNVHVNNGDLPEKCYLLDSFPREAQAGRLKHFGTERNFQEVLSGVQMIMAPTEFSATAPLKVLARRYGFRAATLPGFSKEMIPALRLDWGQISERVSIIKELLDRAELVMLDLLVDNKSTYSCTFDLRGQTAHASGGLFPTPGTAGNLPSGEAYIVPVEGKSSRTQGMLPIQLEDEVVLYKLLHNQAIDVLSDGPVSQREKALLTEEPAYGNIAELGFGILAAFGLKPIGEVLLDEKLGFHIAFGRSDHFGGIVGPDRFRKKENVVHIDRIYIRETQPRVTVQSLVLRFKNGEDQEIIKDNTYTIF